MSWTLINKQCPGETASQSLAVQFKFDPTWDPEGSTTGKWTQYSGRTETAYLPFDEKGVTVLELFKIAFCRRSLFKLGPRVSNGQRAAVFDVRFILTLDPDSGSEFNYPHAGFFDNTV